MYLPAIRKALAAFLAALVAAIGLALLDGAINLPEILTALGTALGAGAGTYLSPPNELPAPPKDTGPPEGDVDLLPDLPHAG